MKSITSIIGINFIVLFASILLLSSIDPNNQNRFIYYLPVIVLVVFNGVKSIVYYYKGDRSKAKTFILSSLLILIIGGSSCVSIRFRLKPLRNNDVRPYTEPFDSASISTPKKNSPYINPIDSVK